VQAALALARQKHGAQSDIRAISVRVSRAAALYPGCDFSGPFRHVLQAKMSIPYNVAQALLRGSVDEAGFERLDDPALMRLVRLVTLSIDDAMTAAYPREQGAEVELHFDDGRKPSVRLADVVHASDDAVRLRFRTAVSAGLGAARCAEIESAVDHLADEPDAGRLVRLLGSRDDDTTTTTRQETHAPHATERTPVPRR
jgi:hypothetical protein